MQQNLLEPYFQQKYYLIPVKKRDLRILNELHIQLFTISTLQPPSSTQPKNGQFIIPS